MTEVINAENYKDQVKQGNLTTRNKQNYKLPNLDINKQNKKSMISL